MIPRKDLIFLIDKMYSSGNGRIYHETCSALEQSNLNDLSFIQLKHIITKLVEKTRYRKDIQGFTDANTIYHLMKLNEASYLHLSEMWQFDQTADLLLYLKDSNPQVIDMLNRDSGLLQHGIQQALKDVKMETWDIKVLAKLRNVIGDGLFESSYLLKEMFQTNQPLLDINPADLQELVRQIVSRTEKKKNNFEHLEYSKSGVVSSIEIYDFRVLQFCNKLLTEIAEHERVNAKFKNQKEFDELS